jgi:hypothetical protein
MNILPIVLGIVSITFILLSIWCALNRIAATLEKIANKP